MIPSEILGQVYEQFLGKVIRLSAAHRADVEDKPESGRAGGVFYTPAYIVDYIVKTTVKEQVQGKTPARFPAHHCRSCVRLRLVPAGGVPVPAGLAPRLVHRASRPGAYRSCGIISGSPGAPAGSGCIGQSGKEEGAYELPIYKARTADQSKMRSNWRLTTAERKRILINNIYGVDIDTQAVEVTKLSLLLKVLEEESEEHVSKQLKISAERALPSLAPQYPVRELACCAGLFRSQTGAPVQHGGAETDQHVRLAGRGSRW